MFLKATLLLIGLLSGLPVMAGPPQACGIFGAMDPETLLGPQGRFNYLAKAGGNFSMSGCEVVDPEGRRITLSIWEIDLPPGLTETEVWDTLLALAVAGQTDFERVADAPDLRWSAMQSLLAHRIPGSGLIRIVGAAGHDLDEHRALMRAVLLPPG